MLDGELFDKLARIGSILRKNTAPFGSIQVRSFVSCRSYLIFSLQIIVTGDFFQLPPVARGQPTFAFEAKLWSETVKRTFNLTKVFRQHDQGAMARRTLLKLKQGLKICIFMPQSLLICSTRCDLGSCRQNQFRNSIHCPERFSTKTVLAPLNCQPSFLVYNQST